MKNIFAGLLAVALLMPFQALAAGPGDYSGVIAAGGTSQEIVPVTLSPRSFLFCENPSVTASGVSAESIFINWGAVASGTIAANTGSVELPNGGTLLITAAQWSGQVLQLNFNVVATTTGHKFVCKVG